MFEEFDLQALRHVPKFAHYFRYPLRHRDFHEVREQGWLLGRMAAKPLYGRLTRAGKVDRSAGFNGQVAVIFIPARADASRCTVIDHEDATPAGDKSRRAAELGGRLCGGRNRSAKSLRGTMMKVLPGSSLP